MEGADFLLAISEVALAVVTFSAIVLVLRQLVGGKLSAFHVLTLQMFAICGFIVLFFSLLPFVLRFLGLSPHVLWQVASGMLGVTLLGGNVLYYRQRRRIAPERHQNLWNLGVALVHLIAIVALVLHGVGLIYEGSIGPFAFGLVAGLLPVVAGFFATIQDFLSPSS